MVTPHTLAYGWISYVYKLTTLNNTDKLGVHSRPAQYSHTVACMVKLVLHGNTTHSSIWMDKLALHTNRHTHRWISYVYTVTTHMS